MMSPTTTMTINTTPTTTVSLAATTTIRTPCATNTRWQHAGSCELPHNTPHGYEKLADHFSNLGTTPDQTFAFANFKHALAARTQQPQLVLPILAQEMHKMNTKPLGERQATPRHCVCSHLEKQLQQHSQTLSQVAMEI